MIEENIFSVFEIYFYFFKRKSFSRALDTFLSRAKILKLIKKNLRRVVELFRKQSSKYFSIIFFNRYLARIFLYYKFSSNISAIFKKKRSIIIYSFRRFLSREKLLPTIFGNIQDNLNINIRRRWLTIHTGEYRVPFTYCSMIGKRFMKDQLQDSRPFTNYTLLLDSVASLWRSLAICV